ncbi:MAG: hypothetical protein KME17_03260 [Cyanosarcina radialis HA8281-LM2]|jgi:hypothetical protein|nr:hypothetical protein [Cyanosarcina radialis HA8281-LM2]
MKFQFSKTFIPLLVSVPLVFSFQGCATVRNLLRDTSKNTNQTPSTQTSPSNNQQNSGSALTSSDGKTQITLPSGWKQEQDLNEQAGLQAANRAEEMYIIVISENKQDFQNITLEKHSELTRGLFLKNLTNPQVTGPTPVTIDGNRGVQYELKGGINNINAAYIHTTLETAKNYHQIVAWTLQSRLDQNRSQLQEVIQSLREAGSQTN